MDFGGGKSVIIGDPANDKSPELFRSFGKFVESLNGRFYTGTDMGTTPSDFVHAMKETNCIIGLPEEYGGGGDSSIPTALGVIYGIKAANLFVSGSDDLYGKTYAVQGLGKVGFKVAEQLLQNGANLYVTEPNEKRVAELMQRAEELGNRSVKAVSGEEIYRVEADVFVPCAIGGVLNDETISEMKVEAVVGSANNQLKEERHCRVLQEKGIVYAPDYMVNAGGLIQVTDELYGANKQRVLTKTKAIYDSLLQVFDVCERENTTTLEAANRFCEAKIQTRKSGNSFFTRDIPPKWQIRH